MHHTGLLTVLLGALLVTSASARTLLRAASLKATQNACSDQCQAAYLANIMMNMCIVTNDATEYWQGDKEQPIEGSVGQLRGEVNCRELQLAELQRCEEACSPPPGTTTDNSNNNGNNNGNGNGNGNSDGDNFWEFLKQVSTGSSSNSGPAPPSGPGAGSIPPANKAIGVNTGILQGTPPRRPDNRAPPPTKTLPTPIHTDRHHDGGSFTRSGGPSRTPIPLNHHGEQCTKPRCL